MDANDETPSSGPASGLLGGPASAFWGTAASRKMRSLQLAAERTHEQGSLSWRTRRTEGQTNGRDVGSAAAAWLPLQSQANGSTCTQPVQGVDCCGNQVPDGAPLRPRADLRSGALAWLDVYSIYPLQSGRSPRQLILTRLGDSAIDIYASLGTNLVDPVARDRKSQPRPRVRVALCKNNTLTQ